MAVRVSPGSDNVGSFNQIGRARVVVPSTQTDSLKSNLKPRDLPDNTPTCAFLTTSCHITELLKTTNFPSRLTSRLILRPNCEYTSDFIFDRNGSSPAFGISTFFIGRDLRFRMVVPILASTVVCFEMRPPALVSTKRGFPPALSRPRLDHPPITSSPQTPHCC